MRLIAISLQLAAGSLLLCGCGLPLWRVPKITDGATQVTAPRDAGSPATLHKAEAGTTVALPQGSRVVVTEIAPVPAAENQPAEPARVVTEILPAGPTEYRKQEAQTTGSTGTIDTTVAKHRIDAAERRWLLWAAIVCGIGGLLVKSLLPAWPALSNGLLLGAVLAFASWKLADVPSWLWAVALGVVAVLAMGYKRAEWDANRNGIPDALEGKPDRPSPEVT